MPAPEPSRFAVVEHSNGPTGGIVVREMIGDYLPAPYKRANALATFATRDEAEHYADLAEQERERQRAYARAERDGLIR